MGDIKTLMLWLAVGTAVLYVLTLIGWTLELDPRGFFGWSQNTYAVIEPLRGYLAVIRIGVMCALWWCWPGLVMRWFPDSQSGFETHRHIWMALRNKVFCLFVVLEVCIHISYLGRSGFWG